MEETIYKHIPLIKKGHYENYKILVVEDEIPLAEALSLGLKSVGFKVEIAGDGEEALDKFKSFQPNLILLDILLPKKNGFEVLQEIRQKYSSVTPVPVVILTNLESEDDRERGIGLGADDYLVKANFTLSGIIKKIEHYFNSQCLV